MERIKYLINVLIFLLFFSAVAIQRDGKIMGFDVSELFDSNKKELYVEPETILPDGSRTLNSTSIAKDIVGFGGRTPVKLLVKDDVIQSLEILSNSETPSFMEQVFSDGLAKRWDGMHLTLLLQKSILFQAQLIHQQLLKM